ncbi:hypothetical protein SAMN05421858_4963 [Haladaptatus litoreus]|uniref:DUF7344 domain-containing protein n=1 Tax=Haladaptatus litoreus TaxID=553468 RepID=A0A1N7FD24_9EURY|nr:hypothetical protein [Haladaptatus litoreus]SIR98247.1 hypothetical protein SAMN05421858_4963 [Haladaptatus litoreus]
MSTSFETTNPIDGSSTSDKGSEHPHQLSKDTIYHLLQVQRRRYALRYLQETTDPVRMRDLAEQVAAWEYKTTVDQLVSKERQRTYVSLYQSHLPKLDKEGVIEYNQARGLVTRTDIASQLDPYLTTSQPHKTKPSEENESDEGTTSIRGWVLWYCSGVIVSCGLLTMTIVNFPIVGQVSNQLVLTVIVLLFTLITVGHHVSHQDSTTFKMPD